MEKASSGLGFSVRPTPHEILNRSFRKTVMGYSTAEVDAFLDEMARLAEKAIRTEKELQDRVSALNEELMRWKGREAEIAKLREKAQSESEQLRAEAQADAQKALAEVEERANEIRTRTEQWLEEVIARVEETERRRTSFVAAFRSALDSHYALLSTEQQPEESLGAHLSEFLSGGGETRVPANPN